MAMTREEHLLTQLAEECLEVAHRVTKALRFGLSEIEPGQGLTNADRIVGEMFDASALGDMLFDEGVLRRHTQAEYRAATKAKKQKVERYLKHARECGTLAEQAK